MPKCRRSRGNHFAFAQLLAGDHDRGVHHSQVQVSALRLELSRASHLLDGERFQAIGPFCNVFDEDGPHLRLQSLANPVVDLDEGGGYHDEGLVKFFQEIDASGMRGIVGIENRQDGAGLEKREKLSGPLEGLPVPHCPGRRPNRTVRYPHVDHDSGAAPPLSPSGTHPPARRTIRVYALPRRGEYPIPHRPWQSSSFESWPSLFHESD